ncbi:MAG: hypothetical protein R3Y33_00060 [Clostridia bacterium]
MNSEKTIERLLKLQKLSEQGIGGERENAKQIFEKLLEKHNLKIEDLNKNKLKNFQFKLKSKDDKKLFAQIAFMVVNSTCKIFFSKNNLTGRRLPTNLFVECTSEQALEIEMLYDFYSDLYQSELKLFYIAFLNKHNLFSNDNVTENKKSKFDEDTLTQIFSMMESMKTTNPHTKKLKVKNE